jgi:CheY-like chemotaxis protein
MRLAGAWWFGFSWASALMCSKSRDFASAMSFVEGPRRIDLLLADLGMPSQTPQGMSIARMSLIRRPGRKIIYMTGSDAKYCARYAGDVILQKPFTNDALIEAVRATFEHAFCAF